MSPLDWIALLVWLILFNIPILILYTGASANKWRLWYEEDGLNYLTHPGPVSFVVMIAFVYNLAAVGCFLVWKFTSDYNNQDTPIFISFIAFVMALIFLSCITSPMLWEFRSFLGLCVLSGFTCAISIACFALAICSSVFGMFIVGQVAFWVYMFIQSITIVKIMGRRRMPPVPDHFKLLWEYFASRLKVPSVVQTQSKPKGSSKNGSGKSKLKHRPDSKSKK